MRALVLGGGGHAGSAFVHALLARGHEVATVTRHTGARPNIDGLEIERLSGDDAGPGLLDRWMHGCDLVVDAAAPYALALHEPGKSHAARIEAAVHRVEHVLHAAEAVGAPLVHVGSFVTRPECSTTRPAGLLQVLHPYFTMKAAMERAVLQAAAAGQPVVLVNPTTLMGPGNLRPVQQNFVAAVLDGQLAASFPDTVNIIDVRDAAEAALRAFETGWFGTPIPLSGTNVTLHRLVGMIAEIGAVPRPPQARGLAASAAMLYWSETALALAGLETPYPSLPLLLTLASGKAATGAAQRALGLETRPLEDTVRDEIAWCRSLMRRAAATPAF